MIMADFSIDDDITAALQSLGAKTELAQRRAIRAARPLVTESLEKKTPYEDKSDRSWKAQREYDKQHSTKSTFKHMRDDIIYSGVDQLGHINIGWGKDTYWRVHFVELGTLNQPARPFISSAMRSVQESYLAMVQTTLRKELRL